MKRAGINAVVVDPRRLTLKQLRATVKAARRAGLRVIELVPPANAKATRSVKAVRASLPRGPEARSNLLRRERGLDREGDGDVAQRASPAGSRPCA